MKKHLVFYDGECAFCRAQMRLLRRLDWWHLFLPRPSSEPDLPPGFPVLNRESLASALHCVTRDGRIFRAARAIRFLAWRLPLTAPFAPFLWLPGALPIAEKIYEQISSHRQFLSRFLGCKA